MPESRTASAAAAPRTAAAKRFTPEEANRALPYIGRVVEDICRVYEQILGLRAELENLDDGELRNLTEREYEATMDRLGYLVDELHATGAELRDFELGRIDFPAQVDEDGLMLTWQVGEPAVLHWHRDDAEDATLYSIDTLAEREAA
jgi:hypothetical protein